MEALPLDFTVQYAKPSGQLAAFDIQAGDWHERLILHPLDTPPDTADCQDMDIYDVPPRYGDSERVTLHLWTRDLRPAYVQAGPQFYGVRVEKRGMA